jgi:replicative DNA helicase
MSSEAADERVECEAALLGALFWYPDAFQQALTAGVRPAHYTDPYLQAVFEWLINQNETGTFVAGTTAQMIALAEFEPDIMSHVFASTCALIGVPALAVRIVQWATRDRVVQAAEEMKKRADSAWMGTDADIVSEAVKSITTDNMLAQMGKVTHALAGSGFDSLINDPPVTGAYAGSDALHRMIGGWENGRLYIMAGRPGMGKSTAATSWPLRTAMRGHGIVFFSLEMSVREIEARMLADLAFKSGGVNVTYSDILKGKLSDTDKHKLRMVRPAPPWFILDQASGLTLAELRIKLANHKQALENSGKSLDLLIIDHLGMLKPSGNYRQNKTAEVGEISVGLKELAKEYDIPVLALCQLNRAVESRADDEKKRRPHLSDLRDSGNIEQDADAVLLLYRHAYYLRQDGKEVGEYENKLELIIAKNRSGPTGTIDYFVDIGCAHIADRMRGNNGVYGNGGQVPSGTGGEWRRVGPDVGGD